MSGPLAGYEEWMPFLDGTPVMDADGARGALLAALGVRRVAASGLEIVREWRVDGVRGRELRWRLPFGPATRAYVLEPDEYEGTLPGLLALHCHGGVRSTGAAQLVDTGLPPSDSAARLRRDVYDGLATANDFARAGNIVLAHDTFSWGSRAFDLSDPTPRLAERIAGMEALWRERGESPDADARFDAISTAHEDSIAKAAGMLGTSLAGAVVTDDLAALDILSAWPGVDPERLGAFGVSGGGGRAALLAASDDRVRAIVVACMMATFDSLIPAELDTHSWLLFSPGLRAVGDLPEFTAIGRSRDLLVQYGTQDPLFSLEGMRAADAVLQGLHGSRYRGTFSAVGHEWASSMQVEAREFLASSLDV